LPALKRARWLSRAQGFDGSDQGFALAVMQSAWVGSVIGRVTLYTFMEKPS
jgi:hypothetical protein